METYEFKKEGKALRSYGGLTIIIDRGNRDDYPEYCFWRAFDNLVDMMDDKPLGSQSTRYEDIITIRGVNGEVKERYRFHMTFDKLFVDEE